MEGNESEEFASADEGLGFVIPAKEKPDSLVCPNLKESNEDIPKVTKPAADCENAKPLNEARTPNKAKHKKSRNRKRHVHPDNNYKELLGDKPANNSDVTHTTVELTLNSSDLQQSDIHSSPTDSPVKDNTTDNDLITDAIEKQEGVTKEMLSNQSASKSDVTNALVEPTLNASDLQQSDTHSSPTDSPVKDNTTDNDLITDDIENQEESHASFKSHSGMFVGHRDTMESGIWNPDALSSAASTIVRGVGDGINSLAGALGHALSTIESDEVKEDAAQRRRRRKAEEKAHQRTISEAWSSVWNAAWGDDDDDNDDHQNGDGWDAEDSVPHLELKSEEKKESKLEQNVSADQSLDNCGISSSSEKQLTESWSWAGVSSFAQQLTTSFHEKSITLVHGSVGVLEKIGRKTMSVLEENDPGFQYTKRFIKPPGRPDQPNLSQAIREAHERINDNEVSSATEGSSISRRRGDFSYQLEANRGLVHLEALELVSYQAETKLHIRLTTVSSLHDGPLEVIWESLNFDDDDDDDDQGIRDEEDGDYLNEETTRSVLSEAFSSTEESDDIPFFKLNDRLWIIFQQTLTQLKPIYSGQKLKKVLVSCLRSALSTEEDEDTTSKQEQFFTGISVLAEITSGILEYLHKLTECLLVHTHQPNTDFILITKRIAILLRVTMKLKTQICTKFVDLVKKAPPCSSPDEAQIKPASTSQLIANILLECGNAQSYLKNAASLLIPVLQLTYLVDCSGGEDIDQQD